MITIKQLYEMALAQGYENAVIGLSIEDDDYYNNDNNPFEYIEPIGEKDIDFDFLYDTKIGRRIDRAIWLYNHEVTDND